MELCEVMLANCDFNLPSTDGSLGERGSLCQEVESNDIRIRRIPHRGSGGFREPCCFRLVFFVLATREIEGFENFSCP